MYEEFKDIAEFRMVYITEAHAGDGRRPVDYAKDLSIFEHKKLDDRCEAADRLFKDKALTIPCIIDGMENLVNQAYSAHPDRIFVVRSDGRLAVAGERGPRGFEPAMKDAQRWLKNFRDKKSEPELPAKAADAGEDRHVTPIKPEKEKSNTETGDKAKGNKERGGKTKGTKERG